MALTPAQKHALNLILSGLNDVNDAFVELRKLIEKLKNLAVDEDIDLSQTDIAKIVAKYTTKRTNLITASTNMPEFGG